MIRPNDLCLVTGGGGFIGSHLVDRLVQEGFRVRVLDSFDTGKRENLESALSRIELIEGSLNQPEMLCEAVRDVSMVFHLAALGSVSRSMQDPVRTHEVNATGTLRLLRAARDAKVRRMIYASSSSVYGDSPELPRVETQMARPMSPYAVSKLAAELYCKVFTRQFGLETVILRYFNVFGPRQNPHSPYAAVIPRFIESARNGRSPVIYGDGNQTRDFTYVDNVVSANLLAALAQDVSGEIFNIGTGERLSLWFLLNEIGRCLNVKLKPRLEPARPGDVRDSLASIEKAKTRLGYQVKVPSLDGLRMMVSHE